MYEIQNSEADIRNNIAIAYSKSKPLILLDRAVLSGQDAGFTPAINSKVALLGGRNSSDPAAIKLIPLLQERLNNRDAITPLGEAERHRIVFVQEMGGFSLRCIDGMQELRRSYQDWKGQTIAAKRSRLRGESKDLPIPVHIQKEPPFWDIFPENAEVFKLVILARSLQVLRLDENRSTKERVIRYVRSTVIGSENVDIASSWEEAVQVLEVLACRPDREEIQRQVLAQLAAAQTPAQKRSLYDRLMAYLQQRQVELEPEGGTDSLSYKREANIIQSVIETYQLHLTEPGKTATVEYRDHKTAAVNVPEATLVQPPISTSDRTVAVPQAHIFCTSCGTKNPANSKFCFKCGTKLNQLS